MHKEKIPQSRQAKKGEEKVDSFIFHRSFYLSFLALSQKNTNLKIQLIEKICDFALNGKNEKKDPIIEAFFFNIQPTLEKAKKRYLASKKNGKKGGRPKKKTIMI